MHSIEALYSTYKKDVYAYLLSLTRSPDIAEDLLSETFLAAIRGILRYQGKSSEKTWLFAIARHKWLDHLRRVRGEISLQDLTEYYIDDGELTDSFAKKQAAQRVLALLSEFEPKTQSIVRMRIEGYSYAEIEQQIGVGASSARVIDFRARRKIIAALAAEGYNDD